MRQATPESVVHGKEIHSHTHKQTQLERTENQEITRHIIEKETIEQEHKGITQERVILSEPSSPRPLLGKTVEIKSHSNPRTLTSQQRPSATWGGPTAIGSQTVTQTVTQTGSQTGIQQEISQQDIIKQQPTAQPIPPEFIRKIQPCRAFDGQSAQFVCRFIGEPRPTITWYRESKPIKPSNLYHITTDVINGENSSVLTITRVTLIDNAVYTVKAENIGGSAKSSANLIVEQSPTNISKQTLLTTTTT